MRLMAGGELRVRQGGGGEASARPSLPRAACLCLSCPFQTLRGWKPPGQSLARGRQGLASAFPSLRSAPPVKHSCSPLPSNFQQETLFESQPPGEDLEAPSGAGPASPAPVCVGRTLQKPLHRPPEGLQAISRHLLLLLPGVAAGTAIDQRVSCPPRAGWVGALPVSRGVRASPCPPGRGLAKSFIHAFFLDFPPAVAALRRVKPYCKL